MRDIEEVVMKRLRLLGLVLATLFVLSPMFSREAPKAQAGTPVAVTFTITHVHELHCDEGLFTPCPNDYYTKVDIGGQGFQRLDWCDNCDEDFSPNWAFTKMVDSSQNSVTLLVELWDRDNSPDTDDAIDITAGPNKDLDLTFDLNTCSFQGTGLTSQQGAGIPGMLQGQSAGSGDDSARITFTISTPSCFENSYKIDTDGDGLPDGWEITGLDIKDPNVQLAEVLPVTDGKPDLALNTNPRHKDLFVEVDWMADTTHSHKPQGGVLEDVIKAFANAPVDNPDGFKGITLHADAKDGDSLPDEPRIYFNTRKPGLQDDFDDFKLGLEPGNR